MDTEQEMNSLMKTVKSILERDNRTRNSDKFLIIEVLRDLGFKIYIDYNEIGNMPSFESITRTRRKIQEENPHLKADEEIEDFREEKKSIIREIMKPKARTIEINTFIRPRRGIEISVR